MKEKMDPKRYLDRDVREDLKSKMVFLGGPRQVGKTTFALSLLGAKRGTHSAYLNWDFPMDRVKITRAEIPTRYPLVVLDEIHKFARWRNLVKGLYDRYRHDVSFLVTGSARLDYYRKGGDSLQGRYHYYRLHPLSMGELGDFSTRTLGELLRFGGFPEPFFGGSERIWRRWQSERTARVIHEDLADLERVREVSLIDLLVEALPGKVGSPLSVKNLREDLQVSHEAVERWIQILERLYFCFRISPYSPKNRIRAVKKEQKLYFWDWSLCLEEGGARFENLVASQLLKFCHYQEDTEGYRMELRFLRDTDGREVDFVVLKDKIPLFAVECKSGEKSASHSCRYFRERTAIPKFYQVHRGHKDYGSESRDVRVLPFSAFCRELNLP